MKTKIKTVVSNAYYKARPVVTGLCFSAAAAAPYIALASSSGDARGLAKIILGWVAKLAIIGAIVYGIIGAISYATAHGESDGPAMKKAKDQIVAAIMIAGISALVTAGLDELVGFITA